MLRTPPFEVHLPHTVEEAVTLRSSLPNSQYIAGGTDLLVNLKHHLHEPAHLVSLAKVDGLALVDAHEDGSMTLGAMATLHAVATHPEVGSRLPGLAHAASTIAGPQHRRMGTIGGNVMLDTRCLFYNQSRQWRQSIDYCLKKEGDWCHVIGSAKACVAAQSSDTVPMLIALGASIRAHQPDGATIDVEIGSLFTKDGRVERVHTVPPESLVSAIHIPAQPAGHRSVYRKVRARAAIDFAQLGLGIAGSFDGEVLASLRVVVGAMLPQPKELRNMDQALGAPLTDEAIAALSERAFKQVRPQPNIHGDVAWRRHMARVELSRGLRELRPA